MGLIDNKDAQFMLLAAFIIGIGLVVTTTMLNSIIFEGNLAIDAGNDPSKNEIANLLEITRDEMRNAYRNANGTDNASRIENFTKQMQNFSAYIPLVYARRGEGVNITYDTEWNNKQPPNFTKNGLPNGSANWTIVYGVNASSVDLFKFWNISIFSGKSFKIEAMNVSGESVWSVELNTTGFTVINSTNITYGSPFSSEVNFLDSDYYFKESVSEPVNIQIINGDNAYGKFWIQGIANNKTFYRQRHYVLYSTAALSTSRVRANITIPVTVPW